METIAVYWEPKPKTYGFRKATRLSLLNVVIQPQKMAKWGLWLLKLADLEIEFHLILAKYSNENELRLYILLERTWVWRLTSFFDEHVQPEAEKEFTLTSPVELISFQGPHFGDRYGIANAAFKALDGRKIPILLAACSGAAVYLVLPENKLHEAEIALAAAFQIP